MRSSPLDGFPGPPVHGSTGRGTSCRKLGLCVITLGLAVSSSHAQPVFRSTFLSFGIHGSTEWAAVGDVNRDGHLDFAAPNGSVQTVFIGLGRGDATFASIAELDIYPGLTATLADVNEDGNLDLVCPGFQMVVRLGNGDGTFGPIQKYGISQFTGVAGPSVASADLNGDGRDDFLVGRQSQVQAWLSRGDGTFEQEIESPIAGSGDGVALADVDGDSRMDALVANIEGQLLVLSGHGDGSFGPAVSIGPYEGNHVATADLNRDGRTDVLHGRTVYFGRGDGTFDSRDPFASPLGPYVELYAAADVNGDDALDLVARFDSLLLVVPGNGDGTFQPERGFTSTFITYASVGDFNEDGRPDILVKGTTGFLSLHLGNGDGTFGVINFFETGQEPRAVAIAEVSGDGRPDILTANRTASSVSVLLGNGAGGFLSHSDFPTGAGPRALTVADLDSDGRPDIVTANQDANGISVLFNQGGGSFGLPQDYMMGTSPMGVATADFNGDGHVDVVTSNGGSGDVTLRLGQGAGTLGAALSFPAAGTTVSSAIGDMNNDSHPDVVTGGSVLLGDGAGGLGSRIDYPGGTHAVALGDLNGDGRLDVIASNYIVSRVLLGNGDGALQSPSPDFETKQVRSSALGDVNRDGKLDLVIASEFGAAAWVLLGNGDGTFGVGVGYGGNGWASAAAIGDVNLDDAPDLALASWGSNVVSVMVNAAGGVVAVLPSLVSAEAQPGLVRVVWQGPSGQSLVATAYRRDLPGDWRALGIITPDGSGQLVFEDRDVVAGGSYTYGLGLHDGAREVFAGEITVQVPLGPVLALEGLRPNPAGRDLVASFSLAAKGRATLDVIDLAGRRVLSREVGELGPGAHLENLQPDRRLAPGLYLLRLTSEGRTLTAKGIVGS